MKAFLDKTEQSWEIDLDIGTVDRIAQRDDRFSLLAPSARMDPGDEKSQLQMRLADIRHAGLLFNLLWLLCESQAKARNIDAQQFAKLITPKLLNARRAFFDEWRDFFHCLQQTGEAWMLEELIAQMEQVEKGVAEKMGGPQMEAVKTKARAKLTSELEKSFGGLLDTLESTLAPSPGAS